MSGVMPWLALFERTLARLRRAGRLRQQCRDRRPFPAIGGHERRAPATDVRGHVYGAFLCAREAARHLSRERGGRGGAIVNVSSIAARLGSPNEYVDYAASKAALDTLTLGLAKELGPHGVRVNAVRPGVTLTDIHASGGQPGRAERLGLSTPLGRAGEAEEIAAGILWLLSDEASYTTGDFCNSNQNVIAEVL